MQFHHFFNEKNSLVGAFLSNQITEGLMGGEVGLDDEHGRLRFLEDVTTTTIEESVDTADNFLGTLTTNYKINSQITILKL